MNPWWAERNYGGSKQGYDDSEKLQSNHSPLNTMKKETGRLFARVTYSNNKLTNSLK